MSGPVPFPEQENVELNKITAMIETRVNHAINEEVRSQVNKAIVDQWHSEETQTLVKDVVEEVVSRELQSFREQMWISFTSTLKTAGKIIGGLGGLAGYTLLVINLNF